MDLSIIDKTIFDYLRSTLDTAGYTAVPVFNEEEIQGASVPFVRFSYMGLTMTNSSQTSEGGLQNNYRALMALNTIGKLEGNGRQQVQAIAGILRTAFNIKRKPNNDKIQSDITIDIFKRKIEASQTYEASFQVNLVIEYP